MELQDMRCFRPSIVLSRIRQNDKFCLIIDLQYK